MIHSAQSGVNDKKNVELRRLTTAAKAYITIRTTQARDTASARNQKWNKNSLASCQAVLVMGLYIGVLVRPSSQPILSPNS